MKSRHVSLSLLLYTAIVLSASCTGKSDAPAPGAPPATPAGGTAATNAGAGATPGATPAALPPVNITTVFAQQRVLPVLLKAIGTVTPISSVDVRSQATAVLSKVHFQEGQFVKAGELLFTLDARVDQANVSKAQAQLAKDNAALADAQRQLARSKQLLAQNFISQGAVDTSQAQVDAQHASVSADQAAIDAARIALSYARITAPNSGRAGAVNVFPGSTLVANQTALVTITQLDPMNVTFSLPQRNLADALAALKGTGTEVTATMPEGGGTFKGRLQFVDNAVDLSSGTVKVKAVFDNHDGKLWPGAFVDIAMTVSTLKEAVVVPQASIIQAARGTMVYVIENGKATSRPVEVLYAQGVDVAVSGVRAGESIALDGRQNLRPGSPVVERAKTPAAASSSKAASPARATPP